MRTRLIATPTALFASLALVAGPAFADEPDTGESTTECPGDDETTEHEVDPMQEAAGIAAAAADGLAQGEACPDLEAEREHATEALQAALDRLSEENAGGDGVAAAVLTALLAGESPSAIGAAHGAEMAQAAAERRNERTQRASEAANSARPEGAGQPDDTDVQPAVPAEPALPATPAEPAEPAVPARPAVPASPAETAKPEGAGRP